MNNNIKKSGPRYVCVCVYTDICTCTLFSSLLGALLSLLAMMIQLTASCPPSCVVCSEDITLCQGLTYILAVPASTKALIVTDGSITSVEGFNLSFLFNATLLRLSANGITTIRDDAFLGLRTLKTLLLDQNQISSSSITYSTFHELQKLQVLVLSNNILSRIRGIWFMSTKDLIRLHLNGNQLMSITGESFEMAKLGKLRILDLSNNFISSIEKRAFHGLAQLMEIDLSRNRLAIIPDTFSSLAQLSLLSLDQNSWNCTCKLHDLASFLRKYVNSSSRMLRNADNVSCRASENPSVTNLLELTEVNCKSALKHPPGILENRRRNYGRDVALVAVFSFLGNGTPTPCQHICHLIYSEILLLLNHFMKKCLMSSTLIYLISSLINLVFVTGGVGLTCLVLALFNRKFQHGKANEHSSGNCCCRTLDESQCGHEPRNYLTKGYCNCHLTRENEIKVMSMLGSGRETPLLKENSHQATVKAESKCTGLKMPLRSIQKENEQMKNDHFLCLNCRLLQSYPPESSGIAAVPNEADGLCQKQFQRRVRSPDNFGQWEEDTQATRSEDHHKLNQGELFFLGTGHRFCYYSSEGESYGAVAMILYLLRKKNKLMGQCKDLPQSCLPLFCIFPQEGNPSSFWHPRCRCSKHLFSQCKRTPLHVLSFNVCCFTGIRSDTFCGRHSRAACVLAKEGLGKHLANESCLSVSKTEEDEDCLKPYRLRQRHFITTSSSAPDTPEESKDHCVKEATLGSHGWRQDDPCGSLERSKNISPQLDNFLICKYIGCDKYRNYPTEKKQNHGKNVKLDEGQSEVKSKRAGSSCMTDEEMSLSPAIKRMYQPKSVSFYVPDLTTIKRVDVTSGLSGVRSPENKGQGKSIQGNLTPALGRRLHCDSRAKNEERKPPPTSAGPGEKLIGFIQKHKMKTKSRDSLTVKLNLHPFRKARIQPEELLPKENKEQCPSCRQAKLPHASTREDRRRRTKTKSESEYSVAAQKISECSKDIIYSRESVGKLPEENGTDAVTVISCPSKSVSHMTIAEGTSPAKLLQAQSCTRSSSLFSPNGTSRMTVSAIAVSPNHSLSVLQNEANNIPAPVNSKELSEDITETAVLAFHQSSLMMAAQEKDHSLSQTLFIEREGLSLQNATKDDNMQFQQIAENIMQGRNPKQFQKQQDKSLTVEDGLEGHKKAIETESAQRNLVAVESHSFGEIPPSSRHQIPTEKDINRFKSPVQFSSTLSKSQAAGCLTTKQLQMPAKTNDMEVYGTKSQHQRADFKAESNSESTKMFIPDTLMVSAGLKEEGVQTGNEWENNKCKTFHKNVVKVTIISNTSNAPTSPETETHLESNINLEMKNKVHMDNESDLQEAPNNQLDEHKEGKMPPATRQEHPLLSKLKDVSYEEQTEMPSLPYKTHKAEISVSKPTLSPTSADCDKELPSQAEQSTANISKNIYPSLVLFKDKKPFSI
ncbi:leucine-rich repeat-containing protein 53 [Podarcis muralis]